MGDRRCRNRGGRRARAQPRFRISLLPVLTMAAFLRQLVSVFVLLLGVTAAAAYIVDPYAYWGQPTTKGFNYWKPHAGRHLWDTKKRQYEWVTPATVLAGNSRVEAGFDPESAAWPRGYQP